MTLRGNCLGPNCTSLCLELLITRATERGTRRKVHVFVRECTCTHTSLVTARPPAGARPAAGAHPPHALPVRVMADATALSRARGRAARTDTTGPPPVGGPGAAAGARRDDTHKYETLFH